MSFINEIKTILKLDDKDWKKALSSISAAEKSYVKESKQNTEDLIRTKQSLSSLEQQRAKEIAEVNAKIAKSEANKTKALENGDKALISSVNKRLSLYKQQRREIEANSKIEIDASKQSIKQVANTISTQTQYANLLKKAKETHQEVIPSIDKHNTSMSNLANTTIRYLRWAGTIAGVVYAVKRAWDSTLGAGLDVNKMMEDNTAGIAALLTANTSMVLSNGQVVNSYQKFQMGLVKSKDIINDIRIASKNTYATFPQLTEIFQQAIGQTLAMGTSFGKTVDDISKNTIKLAQRMSNIGGAIGQPMDRIKEEIRSLISGNASTDSLISTMIFGSPTQANEAIRKAKEAGTNGLKDMLESYIGVFDVLEGVKTYTKAQLDLQDAISQTQATLSEPTFNALKDVFTDLATTIRLNKDDFTKWGENIVIVSKFVIGISDEILVAFLGWKVILPLLAKMNINMATLSATTLTYSGIATATAGAVARIGVALKGLAVASAPLAILMIAYEGYNYLIGESIKKEETLKGIMSNKVEDINKASTSQLQYNKTLLQEAIIKKTAAAWEANFQISQARRKDNRPDNELSKEALQERKRLEVVAEVAKAELSQSEAMLSSTSQILTKREDILKASKEAVDSQKELGELTTKLTVNAVLAKEQAAFLKKNEEVVVGLTKQRKEWSDDLLKNEKELAEVKAKYSGSIDFESLDEVKAKRKAIEDSKKAILGIDKEITEANDKSSAKSEASAKKEYKTALELNREYADQQAIKTEIAMFESGYIDDEKMKISLQEIKLTSLATEYDLLTKKSDKEKVLLEIYKEGANYQKLVTTELGKQESFKNIKNFIQYNGDQSTLDQIHAELQINYKDDQESLSSLEKWFEKQQAILDKKDLMVNIKFNGFDEVSTGIATLANSYQDIGKAEKDYQKILNDKNKSETERQQAVIDYRDTTISSYANMTGAVASFYNEDDDRREKQLELQKVINAAKMAMQFAEMAQSTAFTTLFVAQEAVKSSAAGVTAVATAAASSPWTGFITAAAMAAMLASFGVMFTSSGTKTSSTSDAFSAQAENAGTGSILGDMSVQSESMQNSLSILEDYKKPEFKVLNSMNAYLENISNNIGGVTSLLVQQGGFAFGAGATEYNTGYSNNIGTNNTMATLLGGTGTLASAGLLGGFGAMGALSFAGPAGLALMGIDKLLLGGALTNMIGGALNSVMGGLFGKTSVSQSLTDSGITFADAYLKDAKEQLDGSAYQTISTTVSKKSWFSKSSSTSVSSYFQALDDETERQFSLVLSNLYNTVSLAGVALDANASTLETQLDNFVVSIGKISLKGKTGDQIQEQLTAVFGKVGDDIAKATFPLLTSFQHVGEGMFETLTRVSTGMEVAGYYIERLGSAFNDLSYTDILNPQGDVGFNALLQSIVKTDEALYGVDNNLINIISSLDSTAEELYGTYTALDTLRDTLKFLKLDTDALSFASIRGAGSLENLSTGMSAYIENFLTEEEQLSYQTALVQKEFNKLNIAMPISKTAFTSLIESLDLSSESGQELYGRIIVLSESFAEMADSVAEGILTLEESLVTLSEDGFSKFSDSLQDLFDLAVELATSTQSTIQNLKYTQTDDSTNQLVRFNQLLKDFEVSKLTTNTDATKSIYNEILSLSNTLGSDSQYNQDIINKLNTQLTGFEVDKDIIRVNIVDGLGDLLNLNSEQLSQLQLGVKDGKLTSTELNNITDLTQVQKDGILELANNSNYFSTEATLSNLETWSKLQLEAYQKDIAEETTNLSNTSFKYGDYIGKQEQIDIAKSLGVSYESAQPLVQQLQGLDISNNIPEDLSNILGFKTGGISYDKTTAEQIKKLSPNLNSGIVDSLGAIESQASKNLEIYNLVNTRESLYNKEKIESDIAKTEWMKFYNASLQYKTASFKETQEDIESGTIGKITGFYAYDGANRNNMITWYSKYSTEFSQAKTAYDLLNRAKTNGYATGGYTGDGAKYDVAGYVHKGEYVLSQDNLKALGGQTSVKQIVNGGLQKSLDYLSAVNTKTLEKFDIMAETFGKILLIAENQTSLMEASRSDLRAIKGNTAP